jgi:hypothetical protein
VWREHRPGNSYSPSSCEPRRIWAWNCTAFSRSGLCWFTRGDPGHVTWPCRACQLRAPTNRGSLTTSTHAVVPASSNARIAHLVAVRFCRLPSHHSCLIVATMSYEADNYDQRERSPRRRSRSPRRSRRSYSPRSRSRSRDDYRRSERRSRSPTGGAQGSGGYQSYGASRGGAPRSTENKDNMMQSIRDSSQQDRRVYVGNLSYDVKWHHLKDFMRQGTIEQQMRRVAC